MEKLTAKEEEVMQILWDLKKSIVRDIIDKIPNPKPPYTTVASVVRILEKKGFVGHKSYGTTYEYYPLITKRAYTKRTFNHLLQNYFDDSLKNVVSFMVKERKMSPEEIEKLLKMVHEEDKNQTK